MHMFMVNILLSSVYFTVVQDQTIQVLAVQDQTVQDLAVQEVT